MELTLEKVRQLLEEGQDLLAGKEAARLHPAELAEVIESLDEDEKRRLFAVLPARLAAEVVVELSDYSKEQVLEGILTQRLADIIDDMPSDEATDLVAELPPDQAREVLKRIDHEDSAEVRTLLRYPEDTAGGLMQLEMVAVRADQTVQEAIEEFRRRRDEVGELHNVFVVDEHGGLIGQLPLSRLLLADPQEPVSAVMEECPLVIHADEDQEAVAHKFRRYDVVSAPVVDDHERLLGRITIDDVMEVLEEEAQEDLARMAGFSGDDEVFYSKEIFKITRLRLPWLLSNLFGGLVTGGVLWLFKMKLSDALFLLPFIPVINAMAGNMGVQSSTLMVRGFAVGRVDVHNVWELLFKEIRVAVVMGLACGTLVGVVAHFWRGSVMLGVVVGISMTLAICNASLLGTLVPTILKKLGVDPAISSGPVVTTLNDMSGITVYFLVATLFYRLLVN